MKKYPPYCNVTKGQIYYRPRIDGKLTTLGRLGTIDEPLSIIWKRWEAYQKHDRETLESVANQYLKSDRFKKLAPRTQKDYEGYHLLIMGKDFSDGDRFGQIPIDEIDSILIQQFLDSETGQKLQGQNSEPGLNANKKLAYLSNVFKYCNTYIQSIVNPCRGVYRKKYSPRTTVPTEQQYMALINIAPLWFCAALELIYLCRLRRSEVITLTRRDKKDEGLFCRRTKGSENTVIRWSDRLREAVSLCDSEIASINIIHDNGQAISETRLTNAFRYYRKKAGITGITLHDGKGHGITDYDGENKAKCAGHKDNKIVANVYDQSVLVVDSTD